MIGEGARAGIGRGDDVAYAGGRIAGIPDGFETSVEEFFAK
ncbi:hypothetical protein [Mesorhizobium sp. M0622]